MDPAEGQWHTSTLPLALFPRALIEVKRYWYSGNWWQYTGIVGMEEGLGVGGGAEVVGQCSRMKKGGSVLL